MQYRLICCILISFLIFACSNTIKPKLTAVELHKFCYSYIYGRNGFSQNYKEAFKWCSLAAESNQLSSTTLLAELYTLGNGVDKDLRKAGTLYEQAAIQGHPHAQLMVFLVYNFHLKNESTPSQKLLGKKFLELSKERGYPKAIEVYKKFYG